MMVKSRRIKSIIVSIVSLVVSLSILCCLSACISSSVSIPGGISATPSSGGAISDSPTNSDQLSSQGLSPVDFSEEAVSCDGHYIYCLLSFSNVIAFLPADYQEYYNSIDANYALTITPVEPGVTLVDFSLATTPQQQNTQEQLLFRVTKNTAEILLNFVGIGDAEAVYDNLKSVYGYLTNLQTPVNQIGFEASAINILATPHTQYYVVVYKLPTDDSDKSVTLTVSGNTQYTYNPKAGGHFTELSRLSSGPFSYTITIPGCIMPTSTPISTPTPTPMPTLRPTPTPTSTLSQTTNPWGYSDTSNGTIRIVSGSGTFSSVSSANPVVTVSPRQILSGVVTLDADNHDPGGAVIPLIGTPSWGDHSTSWWLIYNWLPVGHSMQTTNVNLPSPVNPGTYYLIFAFQGEMTGDQVASATNWPVGHDVWNDGNDIADFNANQIAQAQQNGTLFAPNTLA